MRTLSLLMLLFIAAAGVRGAETGSILGSVHAAGTNQPLRQAIVYLGAGQRRAVSTNGAPAVVEVRDGALQPRVQVSTRGATLVLSNRDPTLHVLRVEVLNGTNRPVSVLTQAMPYAGFQKSFSLDAFRDAALLKVSGGNGEEAMAAYVAVLPHPWATLSDETGRFTLTAVPAGDYKLYAWHELFGVLARDVKVIAGRPTTIDLEFTSTGPKQSD